MIPGIRDRATFDRLRREGLQVRSRDLRLRFVRSDDVSASPRVAWAISRKVGVAVTRNRIRRRLKAAMTELLSTEVSTSIDAALVIVFPSAAERSYAELYEQMRTLLVNAEALES